MTRLRLRLARDHHTHVTLYAALVVFIVFVLGVTNYLRDDLIEKSKGLAGLLGCGTVLLLLIPFVIVLYMTQA